MREQVVIGRDRELVEVANFVGSVRRGSAALVVEGEAGVGKTTIWNAAIAEANRNGLLVLAARPNQSEARMSFVGLDDLLTGVADEVLPRLAEPQRRALEVALLRAASPAGGLDARTVARAALEAFRVLARSAPLLVAIDDVQWLDGPTARALEFALRRLSGERIGVLIAVRAAPGEPAPLALDRMTDPTRLRRLAVRPLTVGALHDVIELHTGSSLPRSVLLRVYDTSGGSPFHGLEIARALARDGNALVPGDPLPIPPSLNALVGARVTRLPAAAREALSFVAALAQPTVRVVEMATANPKTRDAVDGAVRAGVLVARGDQLAFSHPLLASAVLAGLTPLRRRAVHRRLAEVVSDPEARARHLGLGTQTPDKGVAATLDEGAELALSRGAPSAAAELYEMARRLTPRDDVQAGYRRCLAAARCHGMAGDTGRGRQLAAEVVAGAAPGGQRAEALHVLSTMALAPEPHSAAAFLSQGLSEAEGRPDLIVKILTSIAFTHLWRLDPQSAASPAGRAMAVAEAAGDASSLSRALVTAGVTDAMLGRPGAVELLNRAVALEEDHGLLDASTTDAQPSRRPSRWLGTMLRWAGDLDNARQKLEPLLTLATDRGDENSAGELLYELGELECWAGNWPRALEYVHQSIEVFTLAEHDWELATALAVHAWIKAHRGHVDEARGGAETALARGRSLGATALIVRCLRTIGFLELSLSRHTLALDALAEVAELCKAVADPGAVEFAGDHIEALIAVGRLDDAETRLEWLEQQGRALDRPWALAVASRGRGLLLAAHGDLARAVPAIEQGLQHHARLSMPFERARSLLALGMTQRRARHPSNARRSLTDAQSIFDRLGAHLWSERTTGELNRIGGRRPGSPELTATERRIVDLVTAGYSNPEVAGELFMSRRTVEDHLSKIYRKLGVRSRKELAHRVPAKSAESTP